MYDYKAICDMRKSGASYKEIADKFGCGNTTIRRVLNKHGIIEGRGKGRVSVINAKRHEDAMKTPKPSVVRHLGSGFTILERLNSDRYKLKCNKCGLVFERCVDTKHKTTCPSCKRFDREQEWWAAEKIQPKLPISFSTPYVQTVDLDEIKTCPECGINFRVGDVYIGGPSPSCCSSDCRKRWNKRKSRHVRRDRTSIKSEHTNWKFLYNTRNERVCYLCGKDVDPNDYKITEMGHFIAGPSFPSVDHVTPLAKGGTDTYDNVRMACCRCNAIKSDKVLEVDAWAKV